MRSRTSTNAVSRGSASSSSRASSFCWRTWRPNLPSAKRGCGTWRDRWTAARRISVWRLRCSSSGHPISPCASRPKRCSSTAGTAIARITAWSGSCAMRRSRRSGKAPTRFTASSSAAASSGSDVMPDIRTVGVAGSGTMGAGIAIVAARAGFRTIVYDTRPAALAQARKQTESFFAKSVERRKLAQSDVDAILPKLSGTTEIGELAQCDIVIEAVFEDLAVKHALCGELNKVCPPHTIFASNTSTLSITEIAAGSGRPERFVGMHFCLPAQLMKLVEMSPGLRTTADTFDAAWEFCKAMGQIPVKTQDNPGFILNYFLVPFNNDAIRLVEAGVAAPAEIDRALKTGLGYAMGPLELLDLVGLDTHLLVADALYAATRDPRAAVPALVKHMIAAGQ